MSRRCIPGKTHYFFFTTRTTAGVPSTLASSPVISIYSGAGGTTEFTTGVTLVADYDSRTGLNRVAIDLTDATAFPIGEDFQGVITTGTVNSVSVVGESPLELTFNTRVRNEGIVQAGVAAAGSSTVKVVAPTGRFAGVTAGMVCDVDGIGARYIASVSTTNSAGDTFNFTQALASDPTSVFFRVLVAAPGDTAAPVPADLRQYLGTSVPAANTAGTPVVDAGRIAGTAQTAGDAVASLTAIAAAIAALRPKKNTALAKFPFKMVSSTDHITGQASKTVTATRMIDGAAFGAGTISAVTEVSGGWYTVDLGAGDLNGNTIVLKFTATGCDIREITVITQP